AQAAWERRAPLTPALPPSIQRAYLELLLRDGRGRDARRLWLALVPDGRPSAPGNAVWNGSFERGSLLGWGLDWHGRRGRRGGRGGGGGARPVRGSAGPPVPPADLQQLPDARLRRRIGAGPGRAGTRVSAARRRQGARLHDPLRAEAPGGHDG